MKQVGATVLLMIAAHAAAEEPRYAFVQGDRVEYQADNETWLWDVQGWYGGDLHKLWWKLEGDAVDGDSAESELQLLYSRAVSAWYDAQFGIRYEDEPGETSLVVGLQGLAPYRFEVDTAAFLTENGDLLFSAEFERDLLLSQRLVLQPRLEFGLSAQDIAERAISSGLTETEVELRLRYEVNRKFAPYLGVSWQRTYGDGSRALRAAGEDDTTTTLVVGARFWF